MDAHPINSGQRELEDRYRIVKENPGDQEKTPFELYGDMESWMFQLGEYRLFLNPMNGMWFWYDRVHDDLRDLNHAAGTGIFSLAGDELEFHTVVVKNADASVQDPAITPAGKKFCVHCGAQLSPGKKFCGNCGSPV